MVRLSLRLALVSLLVIVSLVSADTGPYYAGDPVGGGPDFTCDDDPCDPSCQDSTEETGGEPELAALVEVSPTAGSWEDPLASNRIAGPQPYYGACTTDTKDEGKCALSKSKKAFDKCIWTKKGPDCSTTSTGAKKCCDHPVQNGAVNKNACDCSATRIPGGATTKSDNQKCADCMCLAEMSGEPEECMKWMHCVLRFDASGKSPSDPDLGFCEAAVGSSPGNPNSWRYSSARCQCDRQHGTSDPRGVNGNGVPGFNQAYCDCMEGKLSKAQKNIVAQCKRAREAVDCAKVPYDHYAVGTTQAACPCSPSRIRSFKRCGAHVFCDCVAP